MAAKKGGNNNSGNKGGGGNNNSGNKGGGGGNNNNKNDNVKTSQTQTTKNGVTTINATMTQTVKPVPPTKAEIEKDIKKNPPTVSHTNDQGKPAAPPPKPGGGGGTPPGEQPVSCPVGSHWDSKLKSCVPDVVEVFCEVGSHWDSVKQRCVPDETEPVVDQAAIDAAKEIEKAFRDFLAIYFPDPLEQNLIMDLVNKAIIEDKTQVEILQQIRQSSVYQARFPENKEFAANGSGFIEEATILTYRKEVARIAKENGYIINVDPKTNPDYMTQVGSLITGQTTLTEFEHRLDVADQLKRWGPSVRGELERRLGRKLDEGEMWDFFDSEIDSSELDREYENALYAARPAMLGLGVRPDEEVEMLKRYGIDVDQAFAGYQNLARELPSVERLSLIDKEVSKGVGAGQLPSTGSELFNDTPFALLFRAIQLGDGDAMSFLQNQMANEVARFNSGGGVAFSGTQALGLLSPDERRNL